MDRATLRTATFCAVLGGDGTILAARWIMPFPTIFPFSGVNTRARLGFLLEVEPDDVEEDV